MATQINLGTVNYTWNAKNSSFFILEQDVKYDSFSYIVNNPKTGKKMNFQFDCYQRIKYGYKFCRVFTNKDKTISLYICTKKVTKLQVNNSWGKNYTSASHLVDLFNSGVITRKSIGKIEGFHWWRETYNYMTHDGRVIAEVTHNSDFGASTQAYGVELQVTSLVNDLKRNASSKVWSTDFMINQKCNVMRRLSQTKTIKEYYYNN